MALTQPSIVADSLRLITISVLLTARAGPLASSAGLSTIFTTPLRGLQMLSGGSQVNASTV